MIVRHVKNLINTYRVKKAESEYRRRVERAKDGLWDMIPQEAFMAFAEYAMEASEELMTLSVKVQDTNLSSLYADLGKGMLTAKQNALHFAKGMEKLHSKLMNCYGKKGFKGKLHDHHPYVKEAVDYLVKNYGI